MKECKEYYKQKEPGIIIFILGFILAAAISAAVSTYLLSTSSMMIAIIAGGIGGLIGVVMCENIGEAIVMSVIITFFVFIMIKFLPGLLLLKKFIVPALVGLCAGKFVVGIWKEFAS
jgi:hypothetical protein